MNGGPDILREIRAALLPHGIHIRGVVPFDGADGPHLVGGETARSVVLLGNIGGSIWTPFRRWQGRPENIARSEPLDDWSKAVIGPVATALGATAYFPSDPPWQPFQRWAMRAEELKPSPLGILIHPEYGLWHGYRGALGFARRLDAGEAARPPHPCDLCFAKPCLSHCPVDAVTPDGFDVGRCRGHLRQPAGQAGCMTEGCLARAACPVGAGYRYGDEQLAFHMAALNL